MGNKKMSVATVTLERKKTNVTSKPHPAQAEAIKLAYFKIRVAAAVKDTPEARMLLAVIERGLIDAFWKSERQWKLQAREYFRGPVFRWHVSLLGADPGWAALVMAMMFEAERRLGDLHVKQSEDIVGRSIGFVHPSGLGMRIVIRRKKAGSGSGGKTGAYGYH